MKKIVFFLFAALLSVSCEKVIDINTNDENQKFVIEAIVNKDSTEHIVKITRTLDFNETDSYPAVDNALVTLTDNLGNSQVLTLISPGIYKTTAYPGVEGRTYTLDVQVDGKNFQAVSTMPADVPIDSLMFQEFSFGPTSIYYPIPRRMDQANVKNYYLFNLYKNKERIKGIYLQDDEFSDGVEILQPVFGGEYEAGDEMVLEMFCIDQNVYKYFYTLGVNAGGTGGATPANPESNISGGCLGYFSAQTKQIITAIIP